MKSSIYESVNSKNPNSGKKMILYLLCFFAFKLLISLKNSNRFFYQNFKSCKSIMLFIDQRDKLAKFRIKNSSEKIRSNNDKTKYLIL